MNTIASPAVIGYYEAVELLLRHARNIGEYRTHFGLLHVPEDDHCFIRNVALPHLPGNTRQRKQMQTAMDRLQRVLFDGRLEGGPLRIGDIGFGSGGTLEYLARCHPYHSLHGVNINPVQYRIAAEFLSVFPNIHLSNSDFFAYTPDAPFDVLYFIESAFHMGPKAALCERIASMLKPGGEVYLVDIFQEDRLYRRVARDADSALFSYLSVEKWRELFVENGLECTGFETLSEPVANYCRVTTPLEQYLDEIVPAVMPDSMPVTAETRQNFELVYHGYKRLSRQLKRGTLTYGILRFKRTLA